MADFEALLHKYNQGTCTPEETVLLEAWYAHLEVKPAQSLTKTQLAELFLEPVIMPVTRRRTLWYAVSAAASVLLAVGIYFFLWQQKAPLPVSAVQASQIHPGSNSASLTLANGQIIILDEHAKGLLARQPGAAISVGTQGQLQYEPSPGVAGAAQNILCTPKGGMFRVVLPDGSRVWLNAASELRYPVNFRGAASRDVNLKGEAYFEIAASSKQPFIVHSERQTVTVLGTHFNMNAYADEPFAKTTLLEGRVLVQDAGQASSQLRPGQQAVTFGTGIAVSTTDVNAAISWKDGDFVFNDDIHVIMRQLSRWYNVDVLYAGEISNERFIASISRGKDIDQVLKALSLTGRVHFIIKGRTITVMP